MPQKKTLVSTDQRPSFATVPGGMGMPGGRALHEGYRRVASLLRSLISASQRVTRDTLDK